MLQNNFFSMNNNSWYVEVNEDLEVATIFDESDNYVYDHVYECSDILTFNEWINSLINKTQLG